MGCLGIPLALGAFLATAFAAGVFGKSAELQDGALLAVMLVGGCVGSVAARVVAALLVKLCSRFILALLIVALLAGTLVGGKMLWDLMQW